MSQYSAGREAGGTALTPTTNAVAYRIPVGEATVWALCDGYLEIGPDLLQGVEAEDFDALLDTGFISARPHPSGVNAFLVESGGKRTLIDSGAGSTMGPTLGRVPAALDALGVALDSIDAVVATHLHPYHIGGLAGMDLPGAGLIVAGADVDFWTAEATKAQAPADFHPFFDLATSVVSSFGDRVQTISGGTDVGPGLTAVSLPGHTPGHMGVMVESAGTQLLIWADIVHVAPVQLARPDVTIAFDGDPDAARATRLSLLDQVATDRTLVAGSHIAFPGCGHLERSGDGYRFVPMSYPYT
ncbi:MAG: MBL fold metallo-hydrolase [Pseudomonadota bacterium]